MTPLVHIYPTDTVAVALRPLKKGETLFFGDGTITLAEDVPQGHKVALKEHAEGAPVIKYGVPIGHVTKDVHPGQWIHTHNMATNLSGEVAYNYDPKPCSLPSREGETFMGYRRSDGRAATRNEIWIIPTVGCVNEVAHALADSCQDLVQGTVDGIHYFPHPFGCSQTGADHEQTKRLLVALSRHPNAAGVLFLSLGCESCTHQQILDELGDFDHERVRFLTCQDVEDELASGRKIVNELCSVAGRAKREPISTSELVLGMKCGGSDGLSGITANPAIGRVSDILVSEGGTSVLTEVPEMFGAESFLLRRCSSRKVFDEATAMLNGFKDYFLNHGEVVYDNPSPGNKEGGITTLEDKSCGCVQKGGTAPIMAVVPYAGQVTVRGLNLLCAPGNDMVSTTALTAAGCHVVLFSTGRGTPFGSPVPTLKVFTNAALSKRKPNWMDFNAGVIADGKASIDEAAEELWKLVLETAAGKLTSAERRNSREISIWKDGVVL